MYLDVWDDTIRHEIAHAIDFEIRRWSDHSEIWKNIGRQVGCETEHYKDENIIRPDGIYVML
jgi:predicted SprT family Zn-dependent metalloprotease